MGFKSIFRLFGSCFSPPDSANIYEKRAAEAYHAYLQFDGTQPGRSKSHHLDATVVHYRDMVQSLLKTDSKYASTKFTLANAQLEARNMATTPQRHFEEAIESYLEVLDIWKGVNPKPEEYFALLCTLGKVHYELFEMDQDKLKNGSAILEKASNYYQLSLNHPGSDTSNFTEIEQMLGIITWKKCELEGNDIQLDKAIKDHLSSVFKFDSSDNSNFFNDPERWGNIPSVVAHLSSFIDRTPRTPKIRDLALLHLCQALVFRYDYKQNGDPFDLERAEAVAVSAIPLVDSTVGRELKNVLTLTQHYKDERGVATDNVSGPSTRAPMRLSKSELSNGLPFAAPTQVNSPQYIRTHTPMTASTTSFSRIEARNDLQDNGSRSSLPIGPPSSHTHATRMGQTSYSKETSSSTTAANGKGKAKKSSSVQLPRLATSMSQTPSKSSPVSKSPVSQNASH